MGGADCGAGGRGKGSCKRGGSFAHGGKFRAIFRCDVAEVNYAGLAATLWKTDTLKEREFIMAADNSFDVVSKVVLQEVRNAVEQASKEVHARFDLKNSHSEIKLEGEDALQLASADEYKLKAVMEILQQKLVKRGVSLKNLTYDKV